MDPFKVRVDWLCHSAYGDPVVAELHVMGADPIVLRTFPSVPRAIDWSLTYLASRGFDYWCNIDLHQRLDHTHITLHPRPRV